MSENEKLVEVLHLQQYFPARGTNGKKAVVVSKVAQNSPAARYGLKEGDLVVGVNRQPIENLSQLRKILNDKPSVVALNILRGNSNFYLLIQ